jgi:hypothetical protein
VHEYRQMKAAALILLGGFASWGFARALGDAFQLNYDTILGAVIVGFTGLSFFLGGKVVDVCSSWRPFDESA